ncbi:DEAD/DEAH box helicase [Aquamicrobium zhengzhouense]|uniref:DEAD/DEAH box helicase n=1 Tax=Aquamicrobium zhengzhouense TaxID=2781738 RepID=A0ABS0SCC8_9HYPH|nr:DEAD/DEAH box helicase [Aquamicrobium zhengzhouense]MBI1620093.1 DEAD/DEAH box helicase [Aquamicrobium zhengzhouense]
MTLWELILRNALGSTALTPTSGKRPESMMRSYQRFLADSITELPNVLAAAEMGMGKTGATLTGVRRVLRANPGWRCLIVAPLEVSRNTWPDEVHEWEHLEDLTYTVVCGTEKERLAALAVDADLTMINRENLLWLWKTIKGKAGWRWQVLAYDESSRLKGFTVRTKGSEKTKPQLSEFGVLVQARPLIKKVIELSGTPAPNGVWDLGGQARILFGHSSPLGENKNRFKARYFDENQYTYALTPKPGAVDEIMGHMKPVMIGLRSQDYIDLPPLYFNPVYVKLSPKLMTQYREFEETLYNQEHDIEAVNKGVLTNKLLQLANGGLYKELPPDPDDPDAKPKREVIFVHDLKLKALESIIAEAAGKPVLIAYSFKFDKAQIKKRFKDAVFFDEEPNFVKKWNKGEIKIGVSHPASIGHGLNLQHGGHIQVWFGLSWSLELWDQFNRRLARPGQKAPTVFVHVIMAKGTVDERQYESLQTKGITQDDITERIRVRSIPT